MIIAYVLFADDISILIALNHKKRNEFCEFEFLIRSTLNNIYCILQHSQQQNNQQILLHQQTLLQQPHWNQQQQKTQQLLLH